MLHPSSIDFISNYSGYQEPYIVKAKFIVSPTRIYTLDFDQNIRMSELKLMIQKAAHLRSRNFRLFSNGEEYSNYKEETFESLFHGQRLVEFHLDLKLGEDADDIELLLEMNCPCNLHIDKFLLYYCFTCGESVCCECFTKGMHQGHKIQDKCFYLLPTKYLVDKLFENWNQNIDEEYKFKEDQTLIEMRTNINKMIFDKLFDILKNIQKKVTNIIQHYHYINRESYEKVRNIREIKLFCIKLLDELKEKMNIKDILNNEQLFLDFDKAYKKLGNIRNENYKYTYSSYIEFNQKIPDLIKNMINDINDKLVLTLNQIENDQRYDIILNQINIKSIKSFDLDKINNEIKSHIKEKYSDYTKKRFSMNYIFDNYEIKDYSKLEIKNNNEGRKTVEPNNFTSIHIKLNNKADNEDQNINHNNLFPFGNNNINNETIKTINIKEKNEYLNPFNKNNISISNLNNNNESSTFNVKLNHNNEKISLMKDNKSVSGEGKIITTTTTTQIEKQIIGMSSSSSSSNITTQNMESKLIIKPALKINNITENNKDVAYSSSAQISKQMLQTSNSINPPRLFSEIQNKRQTIYLNNNTLNDSFTSNSTLKNINQIAEETLKSINNINNQKIISPFNNADHTEITNKTISSYINDNKQKDNIDNLFNSKLYSFGINNVIPEENTESENEAYTKGIIKKLLNKDYILAPISQTNCIKIVTSDHDEKTIPLQFPKYLDINSFLLDCAYCNYNKVLYITGGINDNKKTNIALSINLNKEGELISKLSSMNFLSACHSMISYNKYLFVIGGKNQSSVERYNIIDNIWEKLNPMNYKRMYPILVIYNGYLYALFGKINENEYCNTIERLRLCNGMEKEKWEMVQFNNPNQIDTRLYGCATHIIDNYLYLSGGKCNEITTDEILYFNFENNLLRKESSTLTKKASFRENKLHKMGRYLIQIIDQKYIGIYIQFS